MAGTQSEPPAAKSTRRSGRLDPSTDSNANDHGCWAYSSDGDRAGTVVAWLASGLRIGQRALYVYDGPADAGLAELGPLDPERYLPSSALEVVSATQVYDLAAPIDADEQLRGYAAAVEKACADGFQGLRIAADISPLVADPARRAAHVSWEQLADRYCSTHPMAPLCLYDTRRITDVDAIVSAHPLQGPHPAQIALYGTGPRRAVLEGELDAMSDDTLCGLLRGLPVSDAELDLSRVRFADGHAVARLHEELLAHRARGHDLAFVAASPAIRRVWSLCGFDPQLLAA
jgi:anti-anti-sigma regulatory factor